MGIIGIMEADNSEILIVDARGLICPEPLAHLRRAMRMANPGAEFELWATDPLAGLDIEALCARGSCQYLGCTAGDDGVLRIRVRLT